MPIAQSVAFAADVDPAAQPDPAAAVQAPEHAGAARFVALPKTPAGQSSGAMDAGGQKEPRGQFRHAESAVAFAAADHVPAGHGIAAFRVGQ